MSQPSNAVMAKVSACKRATIPFTVVCSATTGLIAASIDNDFAGNAEIFVAAANGAAQAPSRGGNGGAAASVIDPSATALLPTLSADTAPVSLDFVVLDGPSDVQPKTIPTPSSGNNPAYSATPAAIGDAKRIYSALAVITDGTDTSIPTATEAVAARADALITPNGNIVVRVTFPKAQVVAAAGSGVAPTMKVAAQTFKGLLFVEWF